MNIYNCYMEKSVNGFCDVISSSMHAYCIQINQLRDDYERIDLEKGSLIISYAGFWASGCTKMDGSKEKKARIPKSTVESDVCIIYFNIFRSSHINRLLLHPFPVCCIRFVLFVLFLFFIIFAIVVNAEFFAHGWRIHNIWELTEWQSSAHVHIRCFEYNYK